MNILSAPLPRHVGDSFIERRAGFILALCFHVMLFAVLAMRERPPIFEASPEPLREIHIQLAPPPPVELVVQPTREVTPEVSDTPQEGAQALGTQAAPVEVEPTVETAPWVTPAPINAMGEVVRSVPPVTEVSEPAPPAPTESEAAIDVDLVDLAEKSAQESAEGSAALQSRLEAARRLVNEAVAKTLPVPDAQAEARIDAFSEQGSEEIAQRLRLLDVDVAAQKTLFRSKGAQEGVVRSLVLTGVDPAASQQVMERYGIRIIPVQGGDSGSSMKSTGPGFLTRASTDVGQFVQRIGKGNFLRFIISRQAGMRMIQLETEEMEKRGFDAEKSRLIEVEFGIVATTDGYDLGVRKLIAEALPDLEDYQKSQDAP